MSIIIWSDDYKVNHVEIDEQHKKLFELANILLECKCKTSTVKAAADLLDYCKMHFIFEENLIRIIKYPDHLNHKEQHTKLIKGLEQIIQKIEDNMFWIGDIEKEILGWLIKHISVEDKKLVMYINKSRYR